MNRLSALLVVALVVLAAAIASGCKQTRPIPAYEPLLALEAATAKPVVVSPAQMYRPSWSGPKPKPRKGGG